MVVLSLARKYVFRRPSQNLAVFLGIALGVSLFVGIQVGSTSLGEGFGALTRYSLGETDASISPAATQFFIDDPTLNYSISEALGLQTATQPSLFAKALSENQTISQYVEEISPRLNLDVTVIHEETGAIEISETLTGVSSDEKTFGEYYNREGNVLPISELQPGEIYLGRALADILFPASDSIIGENLTVSATLFSLTVPAGNQTIPSQPVYLNVSVSIKDIFEERGRGRENLAEYMVTSLDWLQDLVHQRFIEAQQQQPLERQISTPIVGYGPEPITTLLINWKEEVEKDPMLRDKAFNATRDAFISLVGPEFGQLYQYSNTLSLIDQLVEGSTESLELLLNIFGALIAFAALLVIVNIQSMALQAREKETGIMRAIGANRRQLIFTNLAESLFLGIFGSLAGLLGGVLYGRILVFLLGYTFGFPTDGIPVVVTPRIIQNSFWAGVIVSQVTGLIPAINASRVNVAQVLRGLKPPAEERFGRRLLYVGILFTLIDLAVLASLSHNPLREGKDAFRHINDATNIYLAIALLLLGPSLIFAYYRSKKAGLTFASVGLIIWGYFNFLVVLDWIEEGSGGLDYFLYIMLSVISGTIILVGMNLDYISALGEKLFSVFARTRKTPIRGTAMVAFRQMKSKKVRSTMTFALFATILTLNIFLATWSFSFRYGFDNIIVENTAGSDIVFLTGQPIPSTVDFAGQVESEFGVGQYTDSGLNIEFLKPFTVANPTDGYLDADGNATFPIRLVSLKQDSLWENDQWVLQFNLRDNKTGTPYEVRENTPNDPPATEEDEAVWKALVANQTIPNKEGVPTPIIITEPIFTFTPFGAEETHRPGDSVFLNLTDGTLQEFVIASIALDNPLINVLQAFSQGPPGTGGFFWFVNDYWAQKLRGFDGFSSVQNVFLGKTTADDITDERINQLATEIETFANQKDGEFRKQHGLYGVYGFSVYTIYEAFLEIQFRFFNFLQAFTSMGFVVGILGLFVVAMRSVAERQREIGMLRALGFRRIDVVLAVIIELVVMGIIGLLLGLLNGIILGFGLINLSTSGDAAFLIPYPTIMIYVAITIGAALIAAIIPGIKSARIPPSDALRYTG